MNLVENEKPKKGFAKIVLVVLGVLVLLGLTIGGLYLAEAKGLFSPKQEGSGISAIFLTNGQVYFGKISKKYGQYVVLSEVYYLQTLKTAEEEAEEGESAPQPKITLRPTPLESTVLGPTSQIEINKDHILYIEKLREDSKLLQALQQQKEASQ